MTDSLKEGDNIHVTICPDGVRTGENFFVATSNPAEVIAEFGDGALTAQTFTLRRVNDQALGSYQCFLKNDQGTIFKATDPQEAKRLQTEAGYKPISDEEGEAAFSQKRQVAQIFDI